MTTTLIRKFDDKLLAARFGEASRWFKALDYDSLTLPTNKFGPTLNAAYFRRLLKEMAKENIHQGILAPYTLFFHKPENTLQSFQDFLASKSAIGVSLCPIAGKVGIYSPKLPYILPHLIFINRQEFNFPIEDNFLPQSHFFDWGQNQSEFFRFLETYVPYSKVFAIDDGIADAKDLQGSPTAPGIRANWYSDKLGFCFVKTASEFLQWNEHKGQNFDHSDLPLSLSRKITKRSLKLMNRLAFQRFSSEMKRDGRNFVK